MLAFLDRLFSGCQHETAAVYADRLIASQADGLRAERENARLRRSVDCLQDWFARASRRADALDKQVNQEIAEGVRAGEAEERAQACLAQALAEKEDLVTRVLVLEGELRDLERSRDELITIGDTLRAELALPRTGVTTTVTKARKGRR